MLGATQPKVGIYALSNAHSETLNFLVQLSFTHLEAQFNLRYNNTPKRGDIHADKRQRDHRYRVAVRA